MREARESAIVGSERFDIRPATANDIKQMSGVLERAGLSSGRPEILAFSVAAPGAQMFVGCRDDRVAGVAGSVCFGRTGWLGNVAVDDDFRGQAGYWVALPWGGGPVVAADPASARRLVVEAIRASPGLRLTFPELNAHGAALAVSLGFHLVRRVRRMRLGPPVPGYRPGAVYNVFSLAVG
jgi:hypothetical protein